MSKFVKKSGTHLVIKREDVLSLIPAKRAVQLANILQEIEEERAKRGMKTNQSYYVVNCDEPYAEEIMDVIKRGEEAK